MRSLLQFTLDLFDELAAPAPAPAPGAPRKRAQPRTLQPPALAPLLPELAATPAAPVATREADPIGPNEPAASLADTLAPAGFVHPRASREVRLGDARVAYEFTRAKRSTIGFVVGAEGLSVRAPRWVALRDVDAALQEKAGWIVRKLGETRERQQRLDSSRIEWKDGASFQFLGEAVRVMLDPRHDFVGAGAILDAGSEGRPHVLRLALAHNASSAQVRDAAQAWLMRQARRIFTERLDHFAPRLGVAWHKLSLSNAATRWGSARADGAIRLHWRLVHFRMPVIDYVVAHELAHLRVMDHSPRFWETVESVVPDYPVLRRQLKEEQIGRWT